MDIEQKEPSLYRVTKPKRTTDMKVVLSCTLLNSINSLDTKKAQESENSHESGKTFFMNIQHSDHKSTCTFKKSEESKEEETPKGWCNRRRGTGVVIPDWTNENNQKVAVLPKSIKRMK